MHLTNRIDASPVQDDLVDRHSNSLMVELSRRAPGDDTAFTVHFSPGGQVTEEEQWEFPEGILHETRSRVYLLILSLVIL